MAKNVVPDNVLGLLKAADERNGFPAGTMQSIMQQEIGGQFDKFLGDPSAYHYAPDAGGKRKSTAFGPFGILESTGANPGFGVAPLKDKSIEEQVRFASDYLAARSKSTGSLLSGLAAYGEGMPYAKQVAARFATPTAQQVAVAPQEVPSQPISPEPVQSAPVQVAQAPVAPVRSEYEQKLENDLKAMANAQRNTVSPADLIKIGTFNPMAFNTVPIKVPEMRSFMDYGRA